MTSFQEHLKKLDSRSLNAVRLMIILSFTLVFGVVLYHQTFSPPSVDRAVAMADVQVINDIKTGVQVKNEPVVAADSQNPDNLEEKIGETAQGGDNAPETEQSVAAAALISSRVAAGLNDSRNISAKAAIVVDGDTNRVIFQKNADEKLPMASLTKLMTAVVVSENISPEEKIKISKDAVAEDGVAGGLKAGEEFTAEDLMKVMLIVSSNDAAAAFHEYFAGENLDLVGMMNKKAEELGMRNTRFANPAGLDEDRHYSTAHDLSLLAAYVLKNDGFVLSIISRKQATVRSLNTHTAHYLLSTNQLLQKNNQEILGGKTGFTKNAQGCMASILKDGRIVVVLGSEDRFGETEKLIQNTRVESP